MAVPSTTSLDVATTTVGAIPLTTSFAGEPGCKANHLTMIGLLQDEVWLNEPFPASGLTSSECYPTEMLASITATTSMPAFSPLICPDWYTTATRWSQNYIACCPRYASPDSRVILHATRLHESTRPANQSQAHTHWLCLRGRHPLPDPHSTRPAIQILCH